MSTYICDNEHISQIADFLVWPGPHAPSLFNGCQPSDLAKRLWDLNVEAVGQRYGDETPETLPGPIPFGFKYVSCSLAIPGGQTLRSLECFLYQCSEGDVPERDLFKNVERYADSLRRTLLEQFCKEYRDAEWGAYEPPKDAPKVYSLSAMMRNGGKV